MILDKIIWPREEDIDEEVLTLADLCRALSFLRKFIETGTIIFPVFYAPYLDMSLYRNITFSQQIISNFVSHYSIGAFFGVCLYTPVFHIDWTNKDG